MDHYDLILNIIQELLDNDCIFTGNCVFDIIFNNIKPSNNIFNVVINKDSSDITELETYFKISNRINTTQQWTYEDVSKTTKGWIFREHNEPIVTFKMLDKLPKYKKNENKLILTKTHLSHPDGSLKILNILGKKLGCIQELDKKTECQLNWIKYFIKNKCFVYGGWLMRYLRGEDTQNSDIDIRYSENNFNDMFDILEKSGICNHDKGSYGTKINFKSEFGTIIFDIHKIDNTIDCDAFLNMLKLDTDGLSITIIPKKMTFIKSLISVFTDIKNNQYTLIKQFPKETDKKSDIRLLLKPYLMRKEGFKINYNYLQKIEYFSKLENFIVNEECTYKQHTQSDECEYFKINEKVICSNCLNIKMIK